MSKDLLEIENYGDHCVVNCYFWSLHRVDDTITHLYGQGYNLVAMQGFFHWLFFFIKMRND